MNKIAKTIVGLTVASVAVFGLSACSQEKASEEIINPIPAPVSVDLASYDGKTIEAQVGSAIILQVANGTEADWEGTSSDEKVAVFVKGIFSDNVVAIPSITPVAEGKATIDVTNSVTGEEKTLKVEVKK